MKNVYSITVKLDPAGYYGVVTIAGNTRHGTGYYKTAEEAETAARTWVAGMREMEKAANGPTPLG